MEHLNVDVNHNFKKDFYSILTDKKPFLKSKLSTQTNLVPKNLININIDEPTVPMTTKSSQIVDKVDKKPPIKSKLSTQTNLIIQNLNFNPDTENKFNSESGGDSENSENKDIADQDEKLESLKKSKFFQKVTNPRDCSQYFTLNKELKSRNSIVSVEEEIRKKSHKQSIIGLGLAGNIKNIILEKEENNLIKVNHNLLPSGIELIQSAKIGEDDVEDCPEIKKHETLSEELINELSLQKIKKYSTFYNTKQSSFNYNNYINVHEYRNLDKIVRILKSIKGFETFCKFNSIEDEAIKFAANHIEHLFVGKDKTIYYQGENSLFFYGIIDGFVGTFKKKVIEVDLLEPQTTINKRKFNERRMSTKEVINECVNVKGKGECFGYDGVMKKAHRTSTTVAIEDTNLFTLSEQFFDKCFGKSILKSEIERKEFLMERVEIFRERKQYFDSRFKYIKTHNKSCNEVLYSEGSKANSVWIVYLGECVLLKNFKKLKPYEKLNNTKQSVILNISKGGFSTFEALNGGNTNTITKYQGTLVTKSEFTIVLEIVLKELIDLQEPFIKCMQKFKEEQDYLVSPTFENQKKIREKRPVFNETIINYYTRNIDKRIFNIDINKIKDSIQYTQLKEPEINFNFQLSERLNTGQSGQSSIYKCKNIFTSISDFKKHKKPNKNKVFLDTHITKSNNLSKNITNEIILKTIESSNKNNQSQQMIKNQQINSNQQSNLNLNSNLNSNQPNKNLNKSNNTINSATIREIKNKEKIKLTKIMQDNEVKLIKEIVTEIKLKNSSTELTNKAKNNSKNNSERNSVYNGYNGYNGYKGHNINIRYNGYNCFTNNGSSNNFNGYTGFNTDDNSTTKNLLKTKFSPHNYSDFYYKKKELKNDGRVQTAYNLNLNSLKLSKDKKDMINSEDSYLKSNTDIKKTLDLTSAATERNKKYNSGIFEIPLYHLMEKDESTY